MKIEPGMLCEVLPNPDGSAHGFHPGVRPGDLVEAMERFANGLPGMRPGPAWKVLHACGLPGAVVETHLRPIDEGDHRRVLTWEECPWAPRTPVKRGTPEEAT